MMRMSRKRGNRLCHRTSPPFFLCTCPIYARILVRLQYQERVHQCYAQSQVNCSTPPYPPIPLSTGNNEFNMNCASSGSRSDYNNRIIDSPGDSIAASCREMIIISARSMHYCKLSCLATIIDFSQAKIQISNITKLAHKALSQELSQSTRIT